MKFELQYLNDVNGETQAVQLPVNEWQKILNKLKKYEQALKLKSELQEAFEEIKTIKKNNLRQQSLSEFLNEL